MANKFGDLRKNNITSYADAIEFLELVKDKIPQLFKVMKDQDLKIASLRNHVAAEKRRAGTVIQPTTERVVEEDAGVLERLTSPKRPRQSVAEQRLDQMRQSTANPQLNTVENTESSSENTPVAVAPGPGEIGQLNVPDINPKLPDTQNETAPTPDFSQTSEEDATLAAGSKSELPSDDGLQQENPPAIENNETLSPAEIAAIQQGPSEADIKPIGESIAEKTGGDPTKEN